MGLLGSYRDSSWYPGCAASHTMLHLTHEENLPYKTMDPQRPLEGPPLTVSMDCPAPLTPSSRGSNGSPCNRPFFAPPDDSNPLHMSPQSEGRSSAGLISPPSGLSCSVHITHDTNIPTLSTTDVRTTSSAVTSTVSSGTISTAVSSGPGLKVCAGCSENILDPFYLLAVDRKWHSGCLRCVTCNIPLDSPKTLFTRDGLIFCRDDYYRMFGSAKCARCNLPFLDKQMGMKAKNLNYHLECFTCTICDIRLSKGEKYGMAGTLLYCSEHFQCILSQNGPPREGDSTSPFDLSQHIVGVPYSTPMTPLHLPMNMGANNIPLSGQETPLPGYPGQHPKLFGGSVCPPKGRNKKRKPKDEPMDTGSLSEFYIPSGYDLDSPYGPLSSQQARSKRIRTSFKHHQLRTMKSYFDTNHNPDAKDLKILSQKTNLSKRVLQVWFQNARAKWRRQVTTKDHKSGGSCSDTQIEGSTQDTDCGLGDGESPDYNPVTPNSSMMSPGEDSQRSNDGQGGVF